MISIGRFFTKPVHVPDHEEQYEETKEAPLVGVNVHVELIDYCAQVTQTQRFRNNEESPLEATYEFELPKGCAVSSFSADVGDRHMIGKVQEKQKAEEKYDDALAAGHSAALLVAKDEDPNTFVLQLGNVAPGIEAFVTITYERLASLVEDIIVLTLDGSDARTVVFADPPAKTPENDARVQPGFHFDVHIATKAPLKSVSSPSHPIAVDLCSDGASVRLAEGADWRQSKDFVLRVSVADPHLPSVRLQKNENAEVAMVSFYPTIDTQQTRCEMIFVLDRSGSMSGSAIECAKSTLQFFLRSLPEEAFFNIYSFGSRFERFSRESIPFNDSTLQKATDHVNSFRANLGGTDIYAPLESIFSQPSKPGYPRQVFILTDGEVRDKERCIDLVKKNASTTRLFAFGIGSDVDKDLVNGMARAGGGSSRLVRDSSSIRESVMNQLEQALQPGLTDIHIAWKDAATGEAIPVRQTPMNPPPIFRGSRLVSFAILPMNCKPCKVVLTGSFGDKEYLSEVDVDTATSEHVAGEQIIKLGVRSLIEDIQNNRGGDSPRDIGKEITDLSVKHGVLSKFTAFVAVGNGGEALEASMVSRRVARRTEMSSRSRSKASFGGGFGGFRMFGRRESPQDVASRLQESLDTLDRREQFLDRKIQQQLAYAQRYNGAGNKRMAVAALKRKKILMDQQEKIAACREKVALQMSSIHSGVPDSVFMPGSGARNMGLSADRVDSMFTMEPMMADSSEISMALSQQAPEPVDEDELLEELEELEELECTEAAAPGSSSSKSRPASEEDELAELEMALLDGSSGVTSSPKTKAASDTRCYSKPQSSVVAAPQSSVPMTKSLDSIIMQQKASGCFSPLALELLGIPESAKSKRPSKLPESMDLKLAEDIWITLLVLVGLERIFGDKRAEWSFLAKKSEKWAISKLGTLFDEWKKAAQAAF